ncbi:MAG: TetR/AcrR family transcriptional regulator [Methanomassiliicoccaceae archaeon]|nr:TetR/AcrR family transcriptional regulator [Methanomassiliicoccaceae archaeon]
MNSKDKKGEIIHRTAELLSSADGASDITTRRIAENAGINPAMVNYYFGSKENLLKEAISAMNGDRRTETPQSGGGSRKAMFDYLVGICETNMQYAGFGLSRDTVSFSNDVKKASSVLFEMKGSHDGKKPDKEDAARIFRTVCFLMAASLDPEGFAECSGTDIRVKSELRSSVSGQLDILLGDSL